MVTHVYICVNKTIWIDIFTSLEYALIVNPLGTRGFWWQFLKSFVYDLFTTSNNNKHVYSLISNAVQRTEPYLGNSEVFASELLENYHKRVTDWYELEWVASNLYLISIICFANF